MDSYSQQFVQLLSMFHGMAMVGMGKIKNPATDKLEKDLNQAKAGIDMLEALQQKTKGNLSPEEEKLLKSMLTDLRLNYVDEMNQTQKQQTQSTESK